MNEKNNYLNDVYLKDSLKGIIKRRWINLKSYR